MPQCLDCFINGPEAHCPICVSEPLTGADFCGYDPQKLCTDCGRCEQDPYFDDAKGDLTVPTDIVWYKVECGVKFYSMATVLERLFNGERLPYDEMRPYFTRWCRVNNVHYYARVREDFSAYEGFSEALDGGFDGVVLEDLS